MTQRLTDLKQTSVWSPSYKIEDYTKQTNCYSLMLARNETPNTKLLTAGCKVKHINIDVWYRNWKLRDQQWGGQDYPKIPYESIEIEVWPYAKTEQFIKDQIEYLLMCKDPCSRKDRWQKYSAMRSVNGKEKKNPDKNFETREEAEKWIDNWTPAASGLKSMPKGKLSWRIVDTEPTNCLSYCPARSVCHYAKSLKK
jgi:hypothetical protein